MCLLRVHLVLGPYLQHEHGKKLLGFVKNPCVCVLRTPATLNGHRPFCFSPSVSAVGDEKPKYDVNKSKYSETQVFKERQRQFSKQDELIFQKNLSLGDYYDTQAFKSKRAISVLVSFFVFMVYFCVLREENDIDEDLYRPLWMSVPSLERQLLEEKIAVGMAKGESVEEYEKRLDDLYRKEKQYQEAIKKDKKFSQPPWLRDRNDNKQ